LHRVEWRSGWKEAIVAISGFSVDIFVTTGSEGLVIRGIAIPSNIYIDFVGGHRTNLR
jgi:hypothetical protein